MQKKWNLLYTKEGGNVLLNRWRLERQSDLKLAKAFSELLTPVSHSLTRKQLGLLFLRNILSGGLNDSLVPIYTSG